MAASFIPPLERAWERTRGMLLRPFDFERWAVVAFAAFLADLAGGGWSRMHLRVGFPPHFDRYVDRPLDLFRDLFAGPVWLMWAFPMLVLSLLLGVALLWISSRGKFVFLDCMLHGRAAVAEPWRRFGRVGNSLFLWRLGYVALLLFTFGALLAPTVSFGRAMNTDGWTRPIGAATLAAAALVTLVLGLIFAYVALLLESFIVPLMYRDGIGTIEAWRRFLPLLRENAVDFLVYGLGVAFAGMALALTLMIAAIVTCCIVPVLLAVPYVNVALLLPLYGVFRLYGVEFLSEFGPQWTIPPSPWTAPPPGGSATPTPDEPPPPAAGTEPAPAADPAEPRGEDDASPAPAEPEPPPQLPPAGEPADEDDPRG